MKKNRSLFLGILALALMFGLVLAGCSNPSGSSGGGGDKGKLEDVKDKPASDLGVGKDGASVDDMIKNAKDIPFASLEDFIEAGGKLEVNGKEVTSGETLIKPDDKITILAPKDEDDDDKDDGGKDDNKGGQDDDKDDEDDIDAGGLLTIIDDDKLSELGFDKAVSANDLIKAVSEGKASGLSDLTAVKGKLYVNNTEVTSGSKMIQPNDTVKILVPKGLIGDDEDDDNKGGQDDDKDDEDDIDAGGLLAIIDDDKLSELGFDKAVSANDLIKAVSEGKASGLSDLTAVKGKLYVNNTEVTSGSKMIQPNDTVKILVPEGLLESFEE